MLKLAVRVLMTGVPFHKANSTSRQLPGNLVILIYSYFLETRAVLVEGTFLVAIRHILAISYSVGLTHDGVSPPND